jgi:AraC-like DNA-binding protein
MTEPCPLNQVKYVRHPALAAVELMIAEPSTDVWQMFHDRYLLCGCISASTTWAYRGGTHHIDDGATGFMEPGEVHRVLAKHKASHFQAVFIEANEFVRLAEEAGVGRVPHFQVAQAVDPQLLHEIVQLGSYCVQENGDTLELQSQLAVVALCALRYAERQPAVPRSSHVGLAQALDRAREFLEDNIHERVTLDELSAASGLSRFHLVHSFSRRYGLPPHAFLIQMRIQRASSLLRSGMPCAQAALSVGFADQSHFARHFKKIMGVSPSEYALSKTAIRSRPPASPVYRYLP